MRARFGTGLYILLGSLLIPATVLAQPSPDQTIKLAFFNIQSGKGEVGLAGRPVLFADTQNCTDATKPVNAWGVGFVQGALLAGLRDDPSILAVGLAEAWVCGSAENVRRTLGWSAKSSTRNGLAVVARYGFGGPETWQQLDTSLNDLPHDTMWVVRIPVCTDAACSQTVVMYAAHWYGSDAVSAVVYDRQAQQTVDFMRQTAGNEPHVLIGDLNVWEGTAQCRHHPITAGLPVLRAAGYIDAWPRIHGTAEGFTGMTNRAGCGAPAGYAWKRIDYSWSSPGLEPLGMTRFAIPEVAGDAAASDHFGIIASYPLPGAPSDTVPPVVDLLTPATGAVVSGTITIRAEASDDVAVTRVEILEDGIVRHTLAPGTTTVPCDTTAHADGRHTFQARAYDAAGNVGVSAPAMVDVANGAIPPPPPDPAPAAAREIVLYARRATAIAGGWRVAEDASAAAGAALTHPNAGASKLGAALPEPAHYFELRFFPAAGRAYRLWIRGRAEGDSWANDSVFVQFSGSVTAAGAPAFRIGTASATAVNLEDAVHAGLAGWGWQDNGYGAGVAGEPLYFDGTPQVIRVQTREDGLSIDQIVLSADLYFAGPPGALQRDTTVLPETAAQAGSPLLADVILRASGAATLAGGWRLVSDPTAADGLALSHPDAGAPKLTAALAAPVHYVEMTFNAEAGRAYRLWLRGRADRDSWANDSVFIQFSGTVDSGGSAVHRIGTTDSTTVNLEDAAGAGLAGWGWQDNGWGAGVLGPLVQFAAGGPQTIRIQTREDGLRFDQIVLSSGAYLSAAPGPLKGDTTILR